MIRKIIHIDEEKCTGCGICVKACHEGAIDLVNGKAKLVRENFCDGFGDCLPECPTGAISFEEREAPAYDEAAVKESMKQKQHVCPGGQSQRFTVAEAPVVETPRVSRLAQWPCQIKLMPIQSELYDGADLLIAADCSAYAYANIHEDFMKDRITIIGCPKLDQVDYTEKLSAIVAYNDVKSVTVLRMEVPCCGGIERAAQNAVAMSGKTLPLQVITLTRNGKIKGVK